MIGASFVNGFWLSLGLIVAIGAQNAFILRHGLARSHVFVLCLIAGLCDALLILLGVAGFGAFLRAHPILLWAAKMGGILFLTFYGLLAFRRAFFPKSLTVKEGRESLKIAVLTLLGLTFLNPHVYLDTVILLGAFSVQYEGAALILFALGASCASFFWFFGLGYGARQLTPLFARPASWRVLDIGIGAIMLTLALWLYLQ